MGNWVDAIGSYEKVIKTLYVSKDTVDKIAFAFAQDMADKGLAGPKGDHPRSDGILNQAPRAFDLQKLEEDFLSGRIKGGNGDGLDPGALRKGKKALQKASSSSSEKEEEDLELLHEKEKELGILSTTAKDSSAANGQSPSSAEFLEVVDLKTVLESHKRMAACFMRLNKFDEAIDTFNVELKLREQCGMDRF